MALDTSAVTKQRGFSRFKKTSSPKGLTVNGKSLTVSETFLATYICHSSYLHVF